MPDFSSPKLIVPSLLFAILSPGLILELPTKIPFKNANAFGSLHTSRTAILFHALVFLIVYKLITMLMGVELTKADLIVPTTLFLLLSPGMLLTLPPGEGTSQMAILVHTVVFAVLFAFLRSSFPQFY
jgi:hypothetical protein